jgi:predicted DNA-binding protein
LSRPVAGPSVQDFERLSEKEDVSAAAGVSVKPCGLLTIARVDGHQFIAGLTTRMTCHICNTEVRDMAILSVRLSEETYRRLSRLSEKTKRTKTSFIKEMIEESLYEYEEAYTALDRLNEKNSKYLTTEELEKELGL